jgi:ketosteroid isomerase-like protein
LASQNVEQLLRAFATYNEVFRGGDDAEFMEFVHPEVEWYPATAGMDPVYRGREGVRRWVHEFQEPWQELEIEPEEIVDKGDRVLVVLHLRGKGEASGVDVDMLMYETFRFRDDLVVERRPYLDRAEALEAVGANA